MSNYWKICIEEALAGIGCENIFTEEQISKLSESMAFSSRMESEACGYPGGQVDSKPPSEFDLLKKELAREKDASFCRSCSGTGESIDHGGARTFISSCFECKGNGKIYYN